MYSGYSVFLCVMRIDDHDDDDDDDELSLECRTGRVPVLMMYFCQRHVFWVCFAYQSRNYFSPYLYPWQVYESTSVVVWCHTYRIHGWSSRKGGYDSTCEARWQQVVRRRTNIAQLYGVLGFTEEAQTSAEHSRRQRRQPRFTRTAPHRDQPRAMDVGICTIA